MAVNTLMMYNSFLIKFYRSNKCAVSLLFPDRHNNKIREWLYPTFRMVSYRQN